MKKNSLFVKISAVMLIALIVSLICSSCDINDLFAEFKTSENSSSDSTALSSDYKGYFGFAALDRCANSDQMKYVYDRVYQGVEAQKSEIVLTGYKIDKDLLTAAFEVYIYDHPEHYYLDPGSYEMMLQEDDTVNSLRLKYSFDKDARKKADEQINNKIAEVLDGAKSISDPYEVEVYLHDWIVKNTEYKDGTNAHDIYGVFVKGQSVCEGYAKAFELLMQKAGFESYLVTGVGRNVNHAWNLVKILNQYCYVDTTWDDADSDYTSHAYFNMTTAQTLEDRKINEGTIVFPECTANELHYFNRHDMIVKKPYEDVDWTKHVENHTFTVALEHLDDLEDFKAFLQKNIKSVMSVDSTDGKKYMFELSLNGREIHAELIAANA